MALSDAERLSAALTEASILLLDLIGMEDETGTYSFPPRLNFEQLPLGGLRAAQHAATYLMLGTELLDNAIAGDQPETIVTLDEELRALLGDAA